MPFLKKILLGISLIFCWLAFFIGASSPLYYSILRNDLIRYYEYYGDLYRFSNLPQFKQKQPICTRPYAALDSSSKKNVALYTIGDSFLEEWRINKSDFPYKFYKNIHWHDNKVQVNLDTSTTNVLLLECAERHSRERFGTVPVNYLTKPDTTQPWVYRNRLQRMLDKASEYWITIKKYCFTAETPDHLEHILFSHDWMLPIKEFKATMNLNLFDRVNASTGLSKDKKHIFYYKDTDTTLINSCYNPLPDNELDKMVANMDSTVNAYKAKGFDKVIVSLIPSKASILAPTDGVYNHLIERFEAKVNGRFPVVDIYKQYSENPSKVFEFNETHWTCFGRKIWLENTTKMINKAVGIE
jgi:hypothetical protein